MSSSQDAPFGTVATDGVVHRASPFSVSDTVGRLVKSVELAGAKVFAVVDQDGEAENAGLSLRETKLVIFGNPAAGTPVMQAVPLAGLDLPLKILVWRDDSGAVWMTYISEEWLVRRYGLSLDLGRRLAAADALTGRIASSG